MKIIILLLIFVIFVNMINCKVLIGDVENCNKDLDRIEVPEGTKLCEEIFNNQKKTCYNRGQVSIDGEGPIFEVDCEVKNLNEKENNQEKNDITVIFIINLIFIIILFVGFCFFNKHSKKKK